MITFGEDWFEGIQTSDINDCSTLRDIVCGIFYTYIFCKQSYLKFKKDKYLGEEFESGRN